MRHRQGREGRPDGQAEGATGQLVATRTCEGAVGGLARTTVSCYRCVGESRGAVQRLGEREPDAVRA